MTEGYRTASAPRSARLRLRSREPGFASMAVFAVIASFVMLLAMVTQRTWVQCSNGTCDFHQLGHFGSKSRRVGSREIKATRVVEGEHPRLLVVTKRYEEIEIASDMPVDTLRTAATELDRFVASGAPTHRALIEPSWNKLAYAAIVLAIALGIRLLFEISVWLWFEIEEGELRAYRRSWLGTGVRTASVRLDQVAEIFVKTTPGEDGDVNVLSLRLEDGAVLALEDGGHSHDDRERARTALQALLDAR